MHPYKENFYYYFVDEAAYTCAIVRKYLTPEMSIMQFNTLIRFRKLETVEYFFNSHYAKTRFTSLLLCHELLLDTELPYVKAGLYDEIFLSRP